MTSLHYKAIGYHGCSRAAAESLEETDQWPSPKSGWLGAGTYFWDNDRSTGEWWAEKNFGKTDSAVVGAEIDLSGCLDFTNVFAQNALKRVQNLTASNGKLRRKLQNLRKNGYSADGALIHLAKQMLEIDGTELTGIRVPVHLKLESNTMDTLGSTSLLVSFRMVIVVFDCSIIEEYEVYDADRA